MFGGNFIWQRYQSCGRFFVLLKFCLFYIRSELLFRINYYYYKFIKCNFYFGNVLSCSVVSFAFRTSTLVLEFHSLALWCLNPWLGIFFMVRGCRVPLSEDLVVLLTSRSHRSQILFNGLTRVTSIFLAVICKVAVTWCHLLVLT
jgi:hypothetical protein